MEVTPEFLAYMNRRSAENGRQWSRLFAAHQRALDNGEANLDGTLRKRPTPPPEIQRPAHPGWYFFYGTLMDPELLARIAELDTPAETFPAFVTESTIKYWGQLRVLCVGQETVEGVLWYAPSSQAIRRIREHLGDAFLELDQVSATWKDTGNEVQVHTFSWSTFIDAYVTDEPSDNPRHALWE